MYFYALSRIFVDEFLCMERKLITYFCPAQTFILALMTPRILTSCLPASLWAAASTAVVDDDILELIDVYV